MRRALPLFAASALLVGLSACSATPSPTPSGSAAPSAQDAAAAIDVCSADAGTASEAVKVSGDLGAAPEVSFDKGIDAKTTERSILVSGTGDEVAAGTSAEVAYSIYNGATGDLIESYGYQDDQPVTFAADAAALLPGLAKTIGCQTVGSRIVSVIPAAEAWGASGNDQVGVAAGASLVAVIDVKSVVPTRATGVDQDVPAGLPKVTLADDGTPSVAIPSADAPADLKVAVLKKGDGDVVPDTATVTVQYLGVDWETGETFDTSWGKPAATFALSGVVPGFAQAIAGQTVGSQVLAVIPPDLGYGKAGTDNTSALAGKTLVFVIDILAVN
ncbi:MAG: Peptidylprolyl isomerase [Naasia sp.]|uniref:FKBP-type peptidyl-prolyl cis-trans isomerase n=1 Tax=Naasia sp. TaxID=2546198 RepID=UPI002622D5C0|nr:FKBP-type peptidyl-prolyl cis-trans isomerase [Naasia sp.]MCU1569319.1 Peptidylprolyl isomerase [Naasia sp.]